VFDFGVDFFGSSGGGFTSGLDFDRTEYLVQMDPPLPAAPEPFGFGCETLLADGLLPVSFPAMLTFLLSALLPVLLLVLLPGLKVTGAGSLLFTFCSCFFDGDDIPATAPV